MGWMDDAILSVVSFYARCDLGESINVEKAVFHEPLIGTGTGGLAGRLQLFVPRTTMLDDVIVYLNSARCLFVLRPVPGEEFLFKFVGPVLGHYPAPRHEWRLYEPQWSFHEGALRSDGTELLETFVLV